MPETHLMEMPQIRRELTQRFEQVPFSDCAGPTRSCMRRSTHDRVPLAVHLNFGDPRIVTNILQSKKTVAVAQPKLGCGKKDVNIFFKWKSV